MTFSKKVAGDLVLAFPTPIVQKTVPGAAAVNRRLKEIVLERAGRDPGANRSNQGGWHSKGDLLDWP